GVRPARGGIPDDVRNSIALVELPHARGGPPLRPDVAPAVLLQLHQSHARRRYPARTSRCIKKTSRLGAVERPKQKALCAVAVFATYRVATMPKARSKIPQAPHPTRGRALPRQSRRRSRRIRNTRRQTPGFSVSSAARRVEPIAALCNS